MAVQKCKFCGIILQNEKILARHCRAIHENQEDNSSKNNEKLSNVCN